MAMQPAEWSISGLSVELGIDRRTLSKQLAHVEPVRVDGRTRLYRLREVVEALFDARRPDNVVDLRDAQTRRERMKAELAELDLEERRKNLLPADEVEASFISLASGIRTRLLAVPSKAAPLAYAAESIHEAQEVIGSHIQEALEDLANAEVEIQDPGRASDSAKGRRSHAMGNAATAKADGKRVGRPRKKAQSRGKR